MSDSIKIFLKSEAYPIGDVLGIIAIWKDDTTIHGEVFFCKEDSQEDIFICKECIKDPTDPTDQNTLKADLSQRMRQHHDRYNLRPLRSVTQGYPNNPYASNRFPWEDQSTQGIASFYSAYKVFFDEIMNRTKNQTLKDAIKSIKEVNSHISIDYNAIIHSSTP
ncbi:hypothetical protein ABK01_08290 [Treponema sp. OMZ 305]|uniref:hypothetical protein n=1 Tax=Treponema sp. OMZ 305 TaxID=1659192 RepID=UPI0020A528EC|nr:hypothetical protein [Treponema sp. OMZ 305]UTC58261.1 hypothetical protein ABK01_08290 [Treponema sp. OMZ 305]